MKLEFPTIELAGQFRLVVSKDPDCKDVVSDTGFFDNLITDVGLNRIGEIDASQASSMTNFSTLCGRFVVGAGSAAPLPSDTALQNPIAFATESSLRERESSSYERGWYELTVSHQFGQGQAAGNIAEIGIQRSSISGPLWSRSLILDSEGAPTTISVLDDDFLTCFYTLRILIPQEDVVYNIPVDYGEDGVVPTLVTGRPLRTEDATPSNGWGLKTVGIGSTTAQLQFYTGGLAVPTAAAPLGTIATSQTSLFSAEPYVSDSFRRFVTRTNEPGQHNSQELRTARVGALMGHWQIEFDPPLKKDNTQTMQVTFGYSWARAD